MLAICAWGANYIAYEYANILFYTVKLLTKDDNKVEET